MVIKVFVFFFLLFCSVQGFSQLASGNRMMKKAGLYVEFYKNSGEKVSLNYNDIKGSPYVNDQFEKGYVFVVANENAQNLQLRYNAYSDDVEYLQGVKAYTFINPELIKKINFSGTTYVYRLLKTSKESKNGGFFAVLFSDRDLKLLKKQSVGFLPAKEAASSYEKNKPASFSKVKETYFLEFEKEKPLELPSVKKKVIQIFEAKGFQVKDFMKKEKINVKEEEDLIKLVTYCQNS